MRRVLVSAVVAFALVSCTPTAQPTAQSATQSPPVAWKAACDAPPGVEPADLTALLESMRTKRDIPALAAAVVCQGRVIAAGAAGVRKWGSDTPVTLADPFHLGSCTKMMTATLAARLVEQGKITWETRIEEIFPEFARQAQPGYADLTLAHLLQHRGGVKHKNWPEGMDEEEVRELPGTPAEQRVEYVRRMLATPLQATPESEFIYSNNGYVIAGAMIERAGGLPFEQLMQQEVFDPLGMTTAGFGAMGSPGKVDAPWQHTVGMFGRLRPVEAGPDADLPAVSSASGRIHASLPDWARFIAMHLEGGTGEFEGYLTAETIGALHVPGFGGEYAFGLIRMEREWAGGETLHHGGSNGKNHCVVWMSPAKRFAVLAATNRTGDEMIGVLDRICETLINRYLAVETSPATAN